MISSVEESVREVGPWGCDGDPIRALLKADGHSDLGQPDQMPAGNDSPVGRLYFVGTGPFCFLECTYRERVSSPCQLHSTDLS